MKFFLLLLSIMVSLLSVSPLHAAYEGEEDQPHPYDYEEDPGKRSGWFLGSDQGILFFVGDSSGLVNPQYYGTLFGGYSIKGFFQPMIRLGQAFGSLDSAFSPTTYFFIFEGGFRFNPIRTAVRPFFASTAGFYVLDFGQDPSSPVESGVNFTFNAGGGIEGNFGRSNMFLSGAYRGFVNGGPYLEGVEITIGYAFKF